MTAMIRKLCQCGLVALALLVPASTRAGEPRALKPPVTTPLYDEFADAKRDVAAALMSAAASGKLVVLVFGANWCPDCRAFDADMTAPDLGSTIELNYVTVKIDVARFNKNTDIAKSYGLALRRGIPAAVILRASGNSVDVVDGRQMEGLRAGGRPALVTFFDAAVVQARTPVASR